MNLKYMSFDVVIVGGGPSGSSAANILIDNGISCCIIDKAQFPREKLCGGLLTQKTIDLLKTFNLEEDISKFYNNTTNKVKMYYKNNLFFNIGVKIPYYFTNRYDFDNILVQNFKRKGGILFDGYRVNKIDLKENKLNIDGLGEIKFKYIIGADGANSILRKQVDNNYKPSGFCLEVNVSNEAISNYENCAEIHFGIVPNGYAWSFPKFDSVTIGIGGVYNSKINYSYILKSFLESKNIDYSKISIKGHYVPFGEYIQTPEKDEKLLLVGDAAGLVDPINGEGIYFSLYSGKLAAETIIDSIKNNTSLTMYSEKIKPLQLIVNDGKWLQNIFYKNWIQNIFFRLSKNHNNIASYFCDNCSSQA